MPKPRVAAVVTEYRARSHADVIVGKLLDGTYLLDGVPTEARVEVASMYVDQFPANDMARDLSAKHGVPIYPTIRDALTLGTGRLAVDGVLLIGEHGDYPLNEHGQKLYPRRRLFVEATAVMRESGRVVPTFSDKHLSWSWEEAKATWREARELGLPFMAGSSLPVTWRRPPLDLPIGCRVDEALAIGYDGIEAYGFHALEMLQCMVERRGGGETGITTVTCRRGPAVWENPAWSRALQDAALARLEPSSPEGPERGAPEPAAFLLEYRDGLRATVLMLEGYVRGFAFAARLADQPEPVSTHFYLESQEPFGHFARLLRRFEDMVLSGQPPYPIERTVLTTGALDFLMRSRGQRLETPELAIAYEPKG